MPLYSPRSSSRPRSSAHPSHKRAIQLEQLEARRVMAAALLESTSLPAHDYGIDPVIAQMAGIQAATMPTAEGEGGGQEQVFYYSPSVAGYVKNSNHSKLAVDDSDIVKLTIFNNHYWKHEIYFDGSDVGLTTHDENIDAFAIRRDGSLLISTEGKATVSGVTAQHEDLLLFRPTKLGSHTSGTWQLYFDGSDVGLSSAEGLDGVSELPDGRLIISVHCAGQIPGVSGHNQPEDLVAFTPITTGSHTTGTWTRFFDGSDAYLGSGYENVDGVSVDDDGTTIHLSTSSLFWVPGLVGFSRDIFTFEASGLGSNTTGTYRTPLTLNGSHRGMLFNSVDAIHVPSQTVANQPPVIDAIGSPSIPELAPYGLQLSASDPDTPISQLVWSLVSGPSGASINATGQFTWTPTESQGPGNFPVSVSVSDGSLTAQATFTISVTEVNQSPSIAPLAAQSVDEGTQLSVQVNASDADLPAQALTYALGPGAPSGATISSSGLFQYTPTEADGPGQLIVPVIVTDALGASSTASISITVREVNQAPVIAPIASTSIEEGTTYNVLFSASDADLPAQALAWSLVSGPTGAVMNPTTGRFAWRPTESQGPGAFPIVVAVSDGSLSTQATFTLTVTEVNQPPVIAPIASTTIEESTTYNVLFSATDPDLPAQALTWSLVSGPTGAVLNPTTGRFAWRPIESQGPGEFPIVVAVSDGSLSTQATFTLTVTEVNQPPVIAPIASTTIEESVTYNVLFSASDADQPAQALTWSLVSGPTGAVLNPTTGRFAWRPIESQGPGVFPIVIAVSDGSLSTQATFTLTVTEVNQPPVLVPIGNQTMSNNQTLSLLAVATDPDLPANVLTYSLVTAPTSATINPQTGLITWLADQTGTVPFTVQVTDNGTPALFDTESFTIMLASCSFDAEAYTFGESGGSTNPGSGSIAGCGVRLVEGDSFEVNASVDITIPAEPSHFVFRYSDLHFDNADNRGVPNDAFEVAIVDAAGNSLVHAVEPGRDAYFNVSEQALTQAGVNAQVTGNEVKLDLSHIPADTVATIIFRLVNNDADQTTGVLITPVSITPGALGTPSGLVPPAIVEDSVVNLNAFSDVTPSMAVHYGNSSYNPASGSYFANYSLQNLANYAIDGPFVVIVKNISSAGVGIVAPDGFTTTGEPYYIVNGSEVSADGSLAAGAASSNNVLEFRNATGTQFSYELQILASPNAAPEFVSTPIILVEAGRSYAYASRAVDPNASDTLTYELLVAPSGMSIDAATGLINWAPQTADLGNNLVRIRVSDGRGGIDEQSFAVEVREVVPNRPPVIISSPEVTAFVASAAYKYPVNAIDADADPISYSLDQAPVGMAINPSSGLIEWSPTSGQLGLHTVRVIANDGRGGTAAQEYQLRVLADATNTAPVIVSDPVDSLFVPGFSNPASGTVSPQRISLDLGNGQTFDGTVSITLPGTAARFADIVIAVDESGSMGGDQDWIPGMIPLLDQALKDAGIGSTPENPNRFAIIGGGRQNLVSYFFSQQPNTKYTLYGPGNTVVATGVIDEVLPDELLNLQFEDDGRYVLIVEAQNAADLIGGIDIGIKGDVGDGVRTEQLQLNTLISDDFLLPGQPVEYQFSLNADTLLYFDSQTKDSYSSITWSLEGPTGSLASNIHFLNSDTADATPTYTAVAGEYKLTIDSTYDVASDYKFQLIDLAASTPINSGETVSDEFETKVGTHAYRFSAAQGQLFTLLNTANAVHPNSQWRLINEAGEVLISQDIGTNRASFELPATGHYYLLMEAALSPLEGASQLRQPSTFEFTAEISDPAAPTPIVLGDVVNGTIDFVSDFVDYSFTLPSRANVYVDSLVDTAMTWTLSGPAGSRAAVSFRATDSINNADPVMNLIAGDYTLRVNSNGQTGAFAFRVTDIATATGITAGVQVDDVLTIPNETKLYRFDANAGDQFFVDIVATNSASGSDYKIYNQFGQRVYDSSSLLDFSPLTIPADGTFTLLVEGRFSNTVSDAFSFNLVPLVSTTRALLLGSVVSGTLAKPGETAVYTFNLATDTQLYFDSLTGVAGIEWSLEGPRGLEIDSLRIDRSDSTDRADATIDAIAGDWRLTVKGTGDTVGDFSFALLDLLNPTHATTITPNPGAANSSVTIVPTPGLDRLQTEVFRFTAAAGDQFSFVTTVTGSNGSYYRIVDTNGFEVTPRTLLSTDRLNQVFTRGGDYLLLVEPRFDNADLDVWSIDVNFVQNNGPTILTGVPLVLGATTNGNLNSASQIDEYTFTVAQRGNYYFDSLTDSGTIRWKLNGPLGLNVPNRAFNGTDSFNQANVTFDLIPGDYQIQIDASSGTPGVYNFRFQDLNDATPITPGTSFTGNLTPASETDLYKFEATAGELFYFDVESASDTANTQYKLIDPFGRRIFTSSSMNDFGLQRADFDGTYTLLVEGWRGNTGLDMYTMNVHRVPAATLTPLIFGAVNSGSFATPGETAIFSFSLNDYTQVHFDSLTNSTIYRWTLTDSLGTIVNARALSQSDASNPVQNVFELVPGDYQLVISGIGETQDYSFRLLDVLANSTNIALDAQTTSVHVNTRSTNIFNFNAQAGDKVFFESFSAAGFSTIGRWRLFDPFGNEIFESGLTTDSGPHTLSNTGTYRLITEGQPSDTGANGTFVFEVVTLGNELNPVVPTEIAFGSVVNGNIAKRFETDRYAFSLHEGTLAYFDALTNDSSLNWTLTNQIGTVVSPRTFNNAASSLLRLPAGDYVVSITSSTVAPYSFTIYDLLASPTIAPGTPQSGELTTANETDIYQFSGLQGDEVYLDVVTVSLASRANVSVVNELGVTLASGTSLVDLGTFTLPVDGQYFVIVEGKINQTISTTYEINLVQTNTISAALELGSIQSSQIDTIGQSVDYTFNLPAEATLYFDSFTDSSSLEWSLETKNRTVVTSRAFSRSDSFDQEAPLLRKLAAGDYTLKIMGVGDATGNFSFRLVDIAHGTAVTPGTAVSGELNIPNETDIYRFEGTAGDRILVDWLAADDTNNSLYRVFDPFENEVFEFPDLLDRDLPALPFTGTYTLLVEGWRANTGLDAYQFKLAPVTSRTLPIAIGDLVTDSIAQTGEVVNFAFDVATDSFLNFDSLTNNSQFNWSLTGPTGEVVASRRIDQSDSVDFLSVFEARTGSYTLTVDGALDATGPVSFQLRDVATGSTIAVPTTVGNAASVSGTLSPGNATDIYRFDANAGDNLTFDAIAATNNFAYYRVVDPFGRSVFNRIINGDQANVALAVSGTYTLLVEGRSTATVPNTYQLNVVFNGNTPPPAFGTPNYVPGTLINATLAAGVTTSYTFDLADRSLLHMDVLNSSSDLRWSLRGPRGVEVADRRFDQTDSIDSATSNLDLVAGRYQMDIFSNSDAAVAFGFTLQNLADAASVTPGTVFPTAPNDTVAAETDLYKFDALAGDRFLIDVVTASDLGNTEFKIIDEYGIVIATSNGFRDLDEIVIPRNGTYTLLVEGDQDNTVADAYSVNIIPIATTTVVLTPGVSSTDDISAGQNLAYTFSITEPSLFLFSPQTLTNTVKWTLTSDAGTFVTAREFDDGVLPVDLLAGNYTLIVDGVGDYAGNTDFTALIASGANQLAFGAINNSQLTQTNSVAVYQFTGVAGQHFALRPDFNLVFDDAATSALTADDLSTAYDNEDGHAAIDVALRNDVFRDGAAINFILITDEDRDVIDDNVNFETIFTGLSSRDALLNVIVGSGFRDENNAVAIGVDNDGNAYIADGLGGFTTSAGGFANTTNISIRQDYVDLAWALDGAAWDLGRLRVGGVTAESFTNAFVDVKVAEILEQTSLRLISSDLNADFTISNPTNGTYSTIVGGQTYDFDIQIGNGGTPRSFDLLFKQGQTIGSIPVYIISPYEYGAIAVDSDGDTLTWSLVEGPVGLAIDATSGILAWGVDSVSYGQHSITVRVEDGRGGIDEQSFVLDVNGGQAASIEGQVYDSSVTADAQVLPPNSYLSVLDSPISGNLRFVVEDFEDGLNTPGVSLSGGNLTSQVASRAFIDSVDADDGSIDGNGNGGDSWNFQDGDLGITITFDETVLGQLPTNAGVVWTDGMGEITFQAFDRQGNLFAEISGDFADDLFTGGTAEDTFFGATNPFGISAIRISNADGAIEIDHVQYNISDLPVADVRPWTIYLDQNRNGLRDDDEQFTETDLSGKFTFENLSAGTYVVAQQPKAGWQQSIPADGIYEITIGQGEDVDDLLFGNRPIPLVNSDPLITSTPLQTIVASEDYRYQPTVTELDGDTLAFDLPLAPAGMVVNPRNGSISWTPKLIQVGQNNVLLRVRDGRGGFDLQYFTITVAKPNTAPIITSTPPAGPAGVGLPLVYDVNAIDADGDSLAFTFNSAPIGATIDAATGIIQWTPTPGQLGTQSFTVSVNDGRGSTAEQAFVLAVQINPANTDPIFLSEPPVEVHLGDVYIYRLEVLDANGDPLDISLAAAPAGMQLVENLISWTPSPNQLGNQTVRILADDGRGGIVSQEYTIRVSAQPINNPPTITSVPITSAVANIAYQFLPTANDPDSDNLFWSLEEGPAGMSMDPVTGRVDWLPTIDDLGPHVVTIQVIDTHGIAVQRTFTLTVRAVNTPPIILSMPRTDAAVGATYLYQVTAQDVDQDRLTFSLANAPSGMTIDADTGRIVWTPIAGQAGSQNVSVVVRDSAGATVAQTYSIAVAAGQPNQLPVITSSANFYATVDAVYSYDVDAIDPDGDAITYTLLNSPAGMNINANSGLITWTPGSVFVDPVLVEVFAQDQSGGGSVQGFGIRVQAANNAPVITSTPPTTLAPGQPFRYDILATDADGDVLAYQLVNGPTGMLIDGVGRMFWIPTADQIGSNAVEVRVTDTRGATATQAFSVTVAADTTAPQVAILPSRNPVNVGTQVDIRVSAVDNVGVNSIVLTVGGVAVPLDSRGIARVQMNTLGSVTASAIVTDAAGNSTTQQIEILVSDPNDVNGPTLLITSPVDGGAITALTNVIGSVTDATLVSYRLLLAEFGSSNFKVIGSGTQNVNNGVLGQIDPTLLQNGSYVLRLEAFDAGGRGNVVEQSVEVSGELKLGNFQLSFTDIVLPISGIPIAVTRVYDSLQADRSADLGYGWRLDYRNADLRVGVPSSGLESIGIYSPMRTGVKVYLTLPGQNRLGWTFNPSIRVLPGSGGSLVLASPRFTPDPGNTAELSAGSGQLFVNEFGELFAAGSIPWNPASPDFGGGYTVRTSDGRSYFINGRTGKIDSITDANGNRLTMNDAGISGAGVSVTLERDQADRITALVAPDGSRISYRYNSAGDLVSVIDAKGNASQLIYSSTRPHYLESVIDPLGNTGVRGEYDANGRLISLMDSSGNSLAITTNLGNNSQVVVDELGHQTIYQYDSQGNTTSETNALGHTTASTFDSNNNPLTKTDPLGRVTTYTYDIFNNVRTVTDPSGGVTTFTYADARRGLVRTITDSLGNTTTYTYDGKGNPISVTDSAGLSSTNTFDARGNFAILDNPVQGAVSYTYDSRGNVTSTTDVAGNVRTFTHNAVNQVTSRSWIQTVAGVATTLTEQLEYDPNGNLIRFVDAQGNQTLYAYDAADNLIAETDALGRVTRFVYNPNGDLITKIYPDSTPADLSDNPRVSFDYDELGRMVSETDELGRVTETVYDAIGRAIEELFPDDTPADSSDNPRRRMEYDAAGQMIATIDENGNRTEFEYDLSGNVILIRDALGRESTFEYDALGRQTKAKDALGHETSYEYDRTGRMTVTTYADNTKARFVYSGSGLVLSQIDQNGNAISYEYDDQGRVAKVTESNGAVTEYTYDEVGNLITLEDANEHVTLYQYDELNRRISVVRPLGESDLSEFDAVGNLVSYTDFNGDVQTFQYDTRDRLTRKAIAGEPDVLFSYLLNGLIATVTDARGTTSYTYDVRDRLINETLPDASTLVYTYDAASNLLTLSSLAGITQYEYDALNRIQLVKDIDGGNTNYTYDEVGRLTSTTFANGVVESRTYTVNGYVASIETSLGATILSRLSYTHDSKGQRLSMTELSGRRVEYLYDSVDRLIAENTFESGSTVAARTVTYSYDDVGNRLQKVDSNAGTTISSYDANDRLLSELNGTTTTTYGYDLNGNQTRKSVGTNTTLSTYSPENRLLNVDTNGDSVPEITYNYDTFGNRVSRTEAGNTVYYQVDTNRGLAEAMVEYSLGGSVITSYTIGNSLISQHRGPETAYYQADSLGSTRQLTDESGAVLNEYTYDAFGAVIAQTGLFENEFLFDGQRRDATTGLDYLRARNYDASTGRMTGVDPFDGSLQRPGSLHNYTYAGNNPINASDPSGRITLVEIQFSSNSLLTIQKSFATAANDGLKRVGRIADKLLYPGAQMQNIGMQIAFSQRSDRDLGYEVYLAGTMFWAAGFSALQVAISGIYADTLANIGTATVKNAFKASSSAAAKALEQYENTKAQFELIDRRLKLKDKFDKTFEFKKPPEPLIDQLIKSYIDSSNSALSGSGLARYVAGKPSNYEGAITKSIGLGSDLSFALKKAGIGG